VTDYSEEIPYDEIEARFLAQVKKVGVRGFGRQHDIDPGVVSRNRKWIRQKKGMADPFTKRLANIMQAERAADLHRLHLAEQAAVAERDRREKEARERAEAAAAKRDAEQKAADARAKREAEQAAAAAAARRQADEDRRQRELVEAFILSCEGWEEKFRAAGYMVEGQMVEGDADELLLAGISDLAYVDVGVAAVALLPDGYVIWRDKTVAFFREGVPYKLRLQPTAVREGQRRPEMIGNFAASVVYRDPLPDQLWRYGKEGVEIITEWGRLTDTYGHLAAGKLPRFVRPQTVAAFERLIDIEEQSEYVFEDSCLGPDAHDRLKALRRRAILPAIAITATKMVDGAGKSAATWFRANCWALLAGLAAVLLAIAVAVGIAWGAILGWSLLKALGNWSKDNWIIPVLAAEALLIGGGVTWWVWPKERDTGWTVAGRICCVVLGLVMIGVVVAGLISIGEAAHEIAVAFNPLKQGIDIP